MRLNELRPFVISLGALLAVAAPAAALQAKPVYQIEAIPFQNHLKPEEATGINSAGVVVGNAKRAGTTGVCFTYAAGVVTEVPDSEDSTCSGINDAGDVIGTVRIGVTRYAAVWLAAGGRQLLTDKNSGAAAINNNAQAAGVASHGADDHATLFTASGPQDLGALGGASSTAYGLNDAGKVVGSYEVEFPNQRAFAWEGGVSKEICQRAGATYTAAYAVNSVGQVLCYASNGTDGSTVFVENPDGTQAVVPGLRSSSVGLGLNPLGHSVGINRWAPVAAYFSNGAETYDLLKLGDAASRATWKKLKEARALNEQDEIVGWGVDSTGQTRPFVARPVSAARALSPP